MRSCPEGPNIITEDFEDGDLTVLSVPPDVVGYVQGQGGMVLRSIEEEWGTLMEPRKQWKGHEKPWETLENPIKTIENHRKSHEKTMKHSIITLQNHGNPSFARV